jgi:hypothetical protein
MGNTVVASLVVVCTYTITSSCADSANMSRTGCSTSIHRIRAAGFLTSMIQAGAETVPDRFRTLSKGASMRSAGVKPGQDWASARGELTSMGRAKRRVGCVVNRDHAFKIATRIPVISTERGSLFIDIRMVPGCRATCFQAR